MSDATLELVKEFNFTHHDFERVRGLIYRLAGISLTENKKEMVYSRLARRLRVTHSPSFQHYLDALEKNVDSDEWVAFTNALTTNLTSFFREDHHFALLADHVAKRVHSNEPMTVWCAASSTGEEPYSIAITLCEAYKTLKPPVKIIATDIDTHVLSTAAKGIYSLDKLDKIAKERIKLFFLKGRGGHEGHAIIRPELRQLIEFRQINLLANSWPIANSIDIIFCRNVMIYFDKPTQKKILQRFAGLLKPNGLLFAGHSENFTYLTDQFQLRGRTVYELSDNRTHVESNHG